MVKATKAAIGIIRFSKKIVKVYFHFHAALIRTTEQQSKYTCEIRVDI